MDYSELIDAIQQDDQSKVNEILKLLIPRLKRYLQIHMNASIEDAEDISQQTIMKVLNAIEEDRIEKKNSTFMFVIRTCRNTYLTYLQKYDREVYHRIIHRQSQQPEQLSSLLEKEQKDIIEWCMKHLSTRYKQFIDYWFTHPESDAKAAATRFDISLNSAWARKHRALKNLNKCFEKKINK